LVADRPKKAPPPRPASGGSLYERYKDALRRGHVASLRGRYEAAIGAYSEAAAIAPDRALPHGAIGGIFVKMGRPADALESYGRALAIAPRDEQALKGRSELLAAVGRRVEAAELLDRLAAVLDGNGRLPDASDAARRALELAESRERRRQVEAYAERLRAQPGDEAAARALAQVLRVLDPPVVAAEPEPEPEPAFAELVDETAVEAEPEIEVVAVVDEPEAVAGAEEEDVAAVDEVTTEPEPEPEPVAAAEPVPEEPLIDAFAVGRAAEDALAAGDAQSARDGLLAAAAAHRRAGRSFAAIDACYLALAVAPADVDLHVLLTELYLERGWRGPAVDKLLLLGRLAELSDDAATRDRLCAIATDQLPDESRLTQLCA
jgi:tetratricopeptide (TPR) repeat protein